MICCQQGYNFCLRWQLYNYPLNDRYIPYRRILCIPILARIKCHWLRFAIPPCICMRLLCCVLIRGVTFCVLTPESNDTTQKSPMKASKLPQRLMNQTLQFGCRTVHFYRRCAPIPMAWGDNLQSQEAAKSALPTPRNTSTTTRSGAQVSLRAGQCRLFLSFSTRAREIQLVEIERSSL